MQQTKLAPTTRLHNGQEIPIVGLGFFQTESNDFEELIQTALDEGYRHFDTAILYENEKHIGQAFKNIFAKGVYKREDIFVTSKVFPFKGQKSVQEFVQQSLDDLQFDYIDLYLLHWPAVGPSESGEIMHRPVHQLWGELETQVDAGKVRSIGVSNYNVQLLFDLLSYARIKPVMNQVEFHTQLQQPGLVDFCNKFNIKITAYSPLGRGKEVLHNEVITQIAQKYGKTNAQISLNFLTQVLGVVVIPKTERPGRLRENFDWRDFTLEQEDIDKLKALDQHLRVIEPKNIPRFGHIALFE